jgi:hypothetical protein
LAEFDQFNGNPSSNQVFRRGNDRIIVRFVGHLVHKLDIPNDTLRVDHENGPGQ